MLTFDTGRHDNVPAALDSKRGIFVPHANNWCAVPLLLDGTETPEGVAGL